MINGRNKGNSYERALALKFVEHGFPDCVTSRSESKRTDDAGVDLCYTGEWNVQAKAVEKLSPSIHQVLKQMPEESMANKNEKGKNVVFWKKNRLGTTVSMTEELFWELLHVYENRNSP